MVFGSDFSDVQRRCASLSALPGVQSPPHVMPRDSAAAPRNGDLHALREFTTDIETP